MISLAEIGTSFPSVFTSASLTASAMSLVLTDPYISFDIGVDCVEAVSLDATFVFAGK